MGDDLPISKHEFQMFPSGLQAVAAWKSVLFIVVCGFVIIGGLSFGACEF
jgi:hypothetical protein